MAVALLLQWAPWTSSGPEPAPKRRPVRGPATLAATLALAGCAEPAGEPGFLRLVQLRPQSADEVFLNERIVLHFSEDLDPASVTSRSVRIQSRPGGVPAEGSLVVQGRQLVFIPRPVLSPDLSDGGYRPGTRYRLELSGFPRPDGLRALSGVPLERNLAWEFVTVDVTEPRSGFVFEDASLESAGPLILTRTSISPRGPIELEGEEPLDPSTLFGEDFLLLEYRYVDGLPGQLIGEPIPLSARLVENHDKHALHYLGRTRVLLEPRRLLEPGSRYVLSAKSPSRLRDFGGHPVRVLGPRLERKMFVTVDALGGGEEDAFFEPFFDDRMMSRTPVAGADGTARWGGGRVEVSWPAAAGSGRDGEVRLDGAEERSDIHATRLSVPSGARCELSAVPGPVVLRAQGSVTLEGRLVRKAGGDKIGFFELWSEMRLARLDSDTATSLEEICAMAPERCDELRGILESGEFPLAPTLSEWLRDAMAAGENCTVIVAGGDLVMRGRVDVDGPLLLVAGGRIRVSDRDELRAHRTYYLGLGDGRLLVSYPDGGSVEAFLRMDPPQGNPIVEPLVFAVGSGLIPEQGRAVRWEPRSSVGGHHGSHGAYRVRYLGERGDGSGVQIVDDPASLTDCPTLRILVELEVRPGAEWDPPWVDFVELHWEGEGR